MLKKILSRFTGNKSNLDWDPNLEPSFKSICHAVRPMTVTSDERLYALYKATCYIIAKNIPGDFVECGVWKGGSAMMMAMTLKQLGVTDRNIYLYDTFSGMTDCTDNDVETLTNKPAKLTLHDQRHANHAIHSRATLDECKSNMQSTGYPMSHIFFIQGAVEQTLPRAATSAIALLRLDTDWYASTRHELECLYPLLSDFGVLLIDDYGFWSGARKAVDEYFKDKPPVLFNRIDFTARLGIKIP